MDGAATGYGVVNEDGTYSVIARITALDGTGSELIQGEGKCIKQADVSTITAKVFDIGTDRDAATGTDRTPAPTISAASNIFDTLRIVGWPDAANGYNFRLDLGAAFTADPDEWRLLEVKITLTGGAVVWLKHRDRIAPLVT